MSEPGREQADREAEARIRLILALISLAYTVVMVWLIIPAHRRQLARMRLLLTGQAAAGKAARRAGVQAMEIELGSGRQCYDLPYALMRLHDRLGRAYERARGALS